MVTRVDPNFMQELKAYGAVGIEKCFNCGNCTAICPLTSDEHPFPRNTSRLIQLGLKDRLLSSTDAWHCYYCGDCSDTCPKGAEPAETMMAVRRWLTAQYDHSGHGAKLYTSGKAAWLAILRFSLIPLVLLVVFHILNAQGIIVFSVSGSTAKLISQKRPSKPVYAFTPSLRVYNRMALFWGITPLYIATISNTDRLIAASENILLDKQIAKKDDLIVIVIGFGLKTGSTNVIKIHRVGHDD